MYGNQKSRDLTGCPTYVLLFLGWHLNCIPILPYILVGTGIWILDITTQMRSIRTPLRSLGHKSLWLIILHDFSSFSSDHWSHVLKTKEPKKNFLSASFNSVLKSMSENCVKSLRFWILSVIVAMLSRQIHNNNFLTSNPITLYRSIIQEYFGKFVLGWLESEDILNLCSTLLGSINCPIW